jgi:beta-lactamase class A
VKPNRRAVLTAGLLLPLAACATRSPVPPATSSSPPRTTPPPPVDTAAADARFAALERQYGARLGVFALDTGTGARITHRAGERFAFCSTFKGLAVAAVLARFPLAHLDEQVPINRADVDSISPITQQHIGQTMSIRDLCDAAIRYSDGTAGNLLVREVGGLPGFNAYLRGLGDRVSRLDNYEPLLNRDAPGDPRDTSTPQDLAADYQRLVLGPALSADRRALLVDWLKRITTGGGTIRAGLPAGWTAANKTGNGDYGRENDVGVLWPPRQAPVVLALMSERAGYSTPPETALLADATRYLVTALP